MTERLRPADGQNSPQQKRPNPTEASSKENRLTLKEKLETIGYAGGTLASGWGIGAAARLASGGSLQESAIFGAGFLAVGTAAIAGSIGLYKAQEFLDDRIEERKRRKEQQRKNTPEQENQNKKENGLIIFLNKWTERIVIRVEDNDYRPRRTLDPYGNRYLWTGQRQPRKYWEAKVGKNSDGVDRKAS